MNPTALSTVLLAAGGHGDGGIIPRGSRVEVFQEIFLLFLVLGTLVGVIVLGYMVVNAYRYRDRGDVDPAADPDAPRLGEIPTGGGGGRKLLLSFSLSAVVVISLVVWTYGTLLYVEQDSPVADESSEHLDVRVEAYQFGFRFTYPNGHTSDGELRVPQGEAVKLTVTSADVFHNFGIPALRVKSDAIPGQTTDTWFIADERGEFEAQCYELCGAGHSFMTAKVVVMEPDAFDRWYENAASSGSNASDGSGGANATATQTASTGTDGSNGSAAAVDHALRPALAPRFVPEYRLPTAHTLTRR